MARHENASKRLAAGALASDLLGFCFIVVGIFGPAWLVVTSTDGQWLINEGIWFARYCKSNECKTSTREKVLEEVDGQFYSALAESHWREFKVLSILAIAGSVIAVVTTMFVLVKKSKGFHIYLLIISGLSALCSSMFLLVPALKASKVDSSASFTDAWTKMVAFVGVFLHCLASVIQVYAVYQSCLNYCAEKKSQKRYQRRLDMVARYLASQPGDCDGTVSVSSCFQPVLDTTGESRLPDTESGISSGKSDPSCPPPYSVAAELPEYATYTLNNDIHNDSILCIQQEI